MGSRHQIAITQFSILALFISHPEHALFSEVIIRLKLASPQRLHNGQHLISKCRAYLKFTNLQKQSSRGVFRKRCFENMQQIYRRTLIPKCDFNKVAKQLY